MISHVVDASIFGPLFFEDEKDDLLADLPGLIGDEACVAPQHWRLEVTNQVLTGLRRKRMTQSMADRAITQIDLLPISVDGETGHRYAESYALACKHQLTIYDAAYLELATRLGLSLATYDAELRKAALAENIKLLPA